MRANTATAIETEERDYYTVPEAARLLRVSRSTVWRWIEAGRLRAYRVGPRNVRIKKEDLEEAVTPVRLKDAALEKERNDIWKGYDPEKVRKALHETAGSWADIDADALIADIYRWREEGSRPVDRP